TDDVELRAVRKGRGRRQHQHGIARDRLDPLPDQMNFCTGQAGEHLQRTGEVELGDLWEQHETDLQRRGRGRWCGHRDLRKNWLDERHPDMVASCPKWHFSLISGHQPKASCMMIGVIVLPDFQLLDTAGPTWAVQ